MRKLKIALEGPINGCTDSDCQDWRKKAIADLGEYYDFHNPMDLDCRGKEQEMEQRLVDFDTAGIASSDIILAMADKPTWGTAMGIQMAWAMHKNIIVVCPSDKPSPWLRNRTTSMFNNFDDAIDLLLSMAKFGRELDAMVARVNAGVPLADDPSITTQWVTK